MSNSANNDNSRRVGRAMGLVGVVFVAIAMVGMTIFLLGATSGPVWVVYTAAVVVAVITGGAAWRIWARLTGADNFYVNFIVHTVLMALALSTAALAVNYFAADKAAMHEERGTVSRVYWQQRHRSRRVGRNRYVQGEPYKVYFIEVATDDGREESFEVPYKMYLAAHRGDSAAYTQGRGRLGLPIVGQSSLRMLNHRKSKWDERRCRNVYHSKETVAPRALND